MKNDPNGNKEAKKCLKFELFCKHHQLKGSLAAKF